MLIISKQSLAINVTLSWTLLTCFELSHAFAWLLKYHVELPDGRIQRVEYYVSGDSGFVAKVSYEENTEAGKAAAAFWEPKNSPFVHKPGMLSMKKAIRLQLHYICVLRADLGNGADFGKIPIDWTKPFSELCPGCNLGSAQRGKFGGHTFGNLHGFSDNWYLSPQKWFLCSYAWLKML